MQKTLTIAKVILAVTIANAQIASPNPPKQDQLNFSVFWGLFKWKGNVKDSIDQDLPQYCEEFYDMSTDTSKHEVKRILWGAIKWTKEKE